MAASALPEEWEAEAVKCKFDIDNLRWEPLKDGEADMRVTVRLSRTDGEAASQLVLGAEKISVGSILSVECLSACFVTMRVTGEGHIGLRFSDETPAGVLAEELQRSTLVPGQKLEKKYEPGSVDTYFQYYAKLVNQQNMLQDGVRTSTYRRAILENPSDFAGHSVMDIGAGSGILSYFSAQAGASTVYAVEASSMNEVVSTLAESNSNLWPETQFKVIGKPVESIADTEVPDKVDVLVSEPIGTFLFNERMIESYLCARDRFLKPGGKMFPNVGNLCIAPFSDATLHWEQQNKNWFWRNTSFYGLNLNAAIPRCTREHFRQPIVDFVNPECLVSSAHTVRFDFATITIESLHRIEIPFDFEIKQPCLVHGMAGWFDAIFEGSDASVTLSTAPWLPGTHWYQIRFLLEVPLAVNAGQRVQGTVLMEANRLQSYYVTVVMKLEGTSIESKSERIDLKDPEHRFYTSPNAYCPPGTPNPWMAQQQQQQQQQQSSWQTQANQFNWQQQQQQPSQSPQQAGNVSAAGRSVVL